VRDRSARVHLGYAVPTGEPVDIPLRHTVVTGQTQEAGKTTALEALCSHGDLRSLVFVTKRGEGNFADARYIEPYFREQADWQFVASVLEASRGERLKFERAWIIRASKGARSLADVQRNVRQALKSAKGLSADVYLTLEAYLDVVVPEIDRVRWATEWSLRDGLNVMDLSDLTVEMQHLVIRSSITKVLESESNTVVVVPEAWKFIPQGRNTPVKLAAEAFIRQAAALGNFLWLDSQDIGGIEKSILRSVPVWILGVQREINEIKRTLENIPAGISKPRQVDIATLELGQFYACFGKHAVKVFVQPAWMQPNDAIQAATGGPVAKRPPQEDTVSQSVLSELRAENERLARLVETLKDQLRQLKASPSSNGNGAGRSRAEDTPPTSRGDAGSTPAGGDLDALYEGIRSRLLKDPVLLKIMSSKPVIDVQVQTRTVTTDGSTWLGFVATLLSEGFFDEPATSASVFAEGKRRGMKGVSARAYEACEKLLTMGFVTQEGKGVGYKAVSGMKVNIVEA
jgi:hypothetical protein